MSCRKDLTGMKFTRLSVISEEGRTKHGSVLWRCKCECGNETLTTTNLLNMGKTRSCGCYMREKVAENMRIGQKKTKTHGMTKERLYRIWIGMRARCTKANHHAYKNYGGRGITICVDWLTFQNFKNDMYESYLTHAETHGERITTLERIDVNGGYNSENCKWIKLEEQASNRRNSRMLVYKGETLSLIEISRKYSISYDVLHKRLESGWSISDAIEKKVETKFGRKRNQEVVNK